VSQEPDIQVEIIPGTFELVMAGRTEEYATVVSERLRELARSGDYAAIAVGQLSMADAARRVAAETGVAIGNPLDSLSDHLAAAIGSAAMER
jgi:hypothetical protein